MKRRFITPILALALTSTALAGTGTALAASHSPSVAKERERSQAGLIASITGFGYALVGGPNARINSYATPALLGKAPAHQVINLIGPSQNLPASFTFRLSAYAGRTGTATMELKRGDAPLLERTQWVFTAQGWKLSALEYAGTIASRESLMTANYAFMADLRQGKNLNSYATAGLLKRSPSGQIINLYGFQNPFRASSLSVNQFSGGTAQVTQRFDFGLQNVQVRIVTWISTADGWKIVSIGGSGRG